MRPHALHAISLPLSLRTTQGFSLMTSRMMAGYLQQPEQYIGFVPTVNNAATNATLPAPSGLANPLGEVYPELVNDPPGHMQAFHDLHARSKCIACGAGFDNNHQLAQHGTAEGHHPYACICRRTFGRLDSLRRHVNSLSSNSGYECDYCSKHDGNNAFARLDNLKQHLKAYHRFEDKFLDTIRQRGARQISVQAETPSQASAAWPMVSPNPPVVFGQSFMPGMSFNAGQDVMYVAGTGQDFNPVQGVGPFLDFGNGQVDAVLPAELDPQLGSATGCTFDLLNFNN
ncbi:uncharacterized protein E0L32_002468 [Thyridium curvatum]|uniref:C2H2-type domain-containing protein n=1 Tax=Thyridium curvatum TaxID=1093900 RepID=A0A507BN10_9PEZI|nr:uncharacterized protein E0L32_002468 [Thyridium curvatum]TPX18611.1 hypothetical protein E0L32_002468 [Thyridium curvatum]